MSKGDRELSSERRLLAAYCFSVRDANEGNYARARARTQKALASVDEDVTPWTQARVEILLGGISFRDGDLQATERHALEAAHLGDTMESEAVRGDALSLLAAVAKARGALGEAEVLYARAARQYWRVGNRSACAVVQLSRAAILNRWGLPTEGARVFRECLRTAMSLDRKATALCARLGLGWTAARQGDLAAARQGLLSAWREARRLLLTREEALALEYLSETYILKGTLPEARVATRLCRRLAERIAPMGDIVLEIGIREAMLSLAEGHPRDAVSKARAAIRHAQRAEMPWERAQAYRVLGVAYVRLGRKQQARKAFLAARELFDTMGEKLELPVVEAWLKALDRPSAEQAGRPESGDQDSASDALRFWLQHPLLGPESWLASRGKRKRNAASSKRMMPGARGSTRVTGDSQITRWSKHGAQAPVAPTWAELGLVTRSPEILEVLRRAETCALGTIPVLILGETGTGKDLIAQGIHRLSGRSGDMVRVNCAAARKELFAAELFGVRRGAYTGAVADRCGLIVQAEGGTIFFDEVGDLEVDAQGILLDFLDSKEVRPVGGTRSRQVETRVLAATCRDLVEWSRRGLFRRDLYGRLSGLVLALPMLRQRSEDIELLIESLWEREGEKQELRGRVFTPEVLGVVKKHSWPENVRQLKHAVHRAILCNRSHGADAAARELVEWVANESWATSAAKQAPRLSGAGPVDNTGDQTRKRRNSSIRCRRRWDPRLLRDALEAANGQVAEAATFLGVSRATAYRLYSHLRESEKRDGRDERPAAPIA